MPFENIIGRAQIIFFSIRDGDARLGDLALAVGGALEPAVHAGAMSGARKSANRSLRRKSRLPPRPRQPAARAPRQGDGQQEAPRRRRRGDGSLEERIGYRFNDAALLDSALTHISALKGARNRAGSYQRLEFLGDHVLGLVISDMLFRAFPKADEGELSRRLADLVRKETCADIARAIDLGAAIRLGASEANAGGRTRPAILADVCEALIGAVYLDGGYHGRGSAGRAAVGGAHAHRRRSRCAIPRPCCRNGRRRAACRRRPIARSSAPVRDHDPEFRVAVQLPTFAPAEGFGRSKRAAEQAAAAAMLAREGVKTERADG